MVTVVIPFAGAGGKTRLHRSRHVRAALAQAMLGDVLAACVPVGRTRVVTPDEDGAAAALDAGAEAVPDPGRGQGAAVRAGLEDAAPGEVLVLNADLPCVEREDLDSLLASTRTGCVAVVEARDGTTNALGLPSAGVFAPLYGSGSAGRFRAHAAELGLDAVSLPLPNLADDVDTMEDLTRLGLRAGPRTRGCLAELELEGSLV